MSEISAERIMYNTPSTAEPKVFFSCPQYEPWEPMRFIQQI